MTYCDLCGKTSFQCLKKEIDGKEFDLCASCWTPMAEKLKGKGRPRGVLEHQEKEQELEEYDEISTY